MKKVSHLERQILSFKAPSIQKDFFDHFFNIIKEAFINKKASFIRFKFFQGVSKHPLKEFEASCRFWTHYAEG
ncbi:hypothetical protein [Lysinibacillus xylanilyticus]|uniref:hypothetical protein n=1 Tax=Lysinibacillus xylanilyticus TaxID=582475 RepID=UPI0036DEB4B7